MKTIVRLLNVFSFFLLLYSTELNAQSFEKELPAFDYIFVGPYIEFRLIQGEKEHIFFEAENIYFEKVNIEVKKG